MPARPFVLGLAAGVIAAAVPVWLLSRGASATPGGPKPHALNARSTDPLNTDVDPTAAENARLRAQIEDLRATLARRRLEGDEPQDVSDVEPREASVEVVQPDRRSDALVAELDEMLRTGLIDQLSRSSPENLMHFLLDGWIQTEHPERALMLLQRLDAANEVGGYGTWLGQLLEARGDRTLAVEAYLLSLKADPSDWQAIMRLGELDPAAALRQRAGGGTPAQADGDFRSQTAMLKLANGQREDAMAEIAALIGSGELSDPVWSQLVEREPAFAEEQLRARIAAGPPDEQAQTRLQLATAMRNQGRTADARQELEAMLTQWPEHSEAIGAIAELDPAGALAYLRNRTMEHPSPTSWALYGERLISATRTEEAIAAFYQAFELSPDSGYQYRLLELAPDRFGPRLAEQANARRDDELYGDIADAYWQRGRRDEALDYWRRALEIDPSDGEWIGKVRAVENGVDPLR